MNEQRIIAQNMAAIEDLDPEQYPVLTKIFRNRRCFIHAHLLQIWSYMQKHKLPRETDHYGHGYWSIRVETLIKEYGGNEETWQSHIAFLVDIGLLKRVKPDERTNIKGLKEAYKDAKEKKHRSPSFFKVFRYTPEIFRSAEEAARRYKAHGINLAHVSKADVIRVSGQQQANATYRDLRKIGEPESWAWDQLKAAILQRISEKGYTTPEEIAGDVAKIAPDPKHEEALKKSMIRKAAICKEAGYRYGPPTKEHLSAYKLEDQRWIITKEKT